MSQESVASNIDLEIEINTDEDEYLANIDFHMIEAAMVLQQDDVSESVINNTDVTVESHENPRFVVSNKELVDQFLQDGLNKNTKVKTDQDIKLFEEFLISVGEGRAILDIPPADLSAHVSNFIYAVRKKDGQEYEPNSLISKFQSIQRYLSINEYGFSLNKDQVFQRCKQVLKSKTKHLKSQGKGNTPNAAAAITSDDIEKFYNADQLGGATPKSLQNSMWYICTNFFGMRTGTEVHSLCWGDVQLKSDDDGTEYLVYSQERQTKTRTGADPRDTRKIKPRAYEIVENPARCPVALYKQFAARRPETMLEPNSPFFLTVATSRPEIGKAWYKKCAMGINKIYSIMKDMKQAANIDKPDLKPYSVRKGMVQTLNDAGVAPNHIIQISGHKNVNSVNNYSSLNEAQQRNISRTLSKVPESTTSASAGNSSANHYVSRQQTESQVTDYVAPPTFPGSASNFYGNRPQSFGQYPPAPRNPYDFLGGFFSGNQISGSINVHFHTSNMSNTSNSNVQAIMNSPPVSKKRRRILPIDSDSE